jgi:hypothetical protein
MIARTTVASIVMLVLAGQSALANGIEPQQIQVIDGDTITVNGKMVHLVGFITPETREAQCKAERDLGDKAAKRLRELIQAGSLDFTPVMCSCPGATLGKFAISGVLAGRSKRTAGMSVMFWSKKGWRRPTHVATEIAPRRRGFGVNNIEPKRRSVKDSSPTARQ